MKDDGHTILSCLKCRTPLVDIWHTKSELVLKSKIKAKCFNCEGESSVAEVEGGMHLGSVKNSDILDIQYLDAEYESSTITNQSVLVITGRGG